jgi:preprotein translocase subunit Sec61beta
MNAYIVRYRSYDSEENGYATIKPTYASVACPAVKFLIITAMRDEDVERVIMKSFSLARVCNHDCLVLGLGDVVRMLVLPVMWPK